MSIEEALDRVEGTSIEEQIRSIMTTGWREYTDQQMVAAYIRAKLRELGEEAHLLIMDSKFYPENEQDKAFAYARCHRAIDAAVERIAGKEESGN